MFSVLSVVNFLSSLTTEDTEIPEAVFHLRISSTCFLASSSLCSLCSPWLYLSSLSLTTEDPEHTEKMFGVDQRSDCPQFLLPLLCALRALCGYISLLFLSPQRTQRSQRRFSPSDIIDLFSCFLFSVLSVLSVVISFFCFSHHRGHRAHRENVWG